MGDTFYTDLRRLMTAQILFNHVVARRVETRQRRKPDEAISS
jgi:hypothetical protein